MHNQVNTDVPTYVYNSSNHKILPYRSNLPTNYYHYSLSHSRVVMWRKAFPPYMDMYISTRQALAIKRENWCFHSEC